MTQGGGFVGVEIRGTIEIDDNIEEMKSFVKEYLAASIANESDGGRMRWYPWHSADYRFNHTLNVIDIASHIAKEEGADTDIVKTAALFHDVAKLEVEQEVHAEEGARIAEEYLESQSSFTEPFIEEVTAAIRDHTYQGDLAEIGLETQCLIEADILDKIGANGTALMLLRMGYESRSHMDAASMVQRVLERGVSGVERLESDTANSLAHRRLKRVKWFKEWLEEEVTEMQADISEEPPE